MKLILSFCPESEIKIDVYDGDRNVMNGSVIVKEICPKLTHIMMSETWATIEFKQVEDKE